MQIFGPPAQPATLHGGERAARAGHTHCRTTVRAKRVIPPAPGQSKAKAAHAARTVSHTPHKPTGTAPAATRSFRTPPPAGSAAIGRGGRHVTPGRPIREAGGRQVAETDVRRGPAQGRGACAPTRRPVIGARQVRRPRPGPGSGACPGKETRSCRLRAAKGPPLRLGLV